MGPRDAGRSADQGLGRPTLPDLFEASAGRHAARPAQAYRGGLHDRALAPEAFPAAPDGAFATLSYADLREVVRRLAAGFRASGVSPGDRVALFARTRVEWAQCDFALLAAGAAVVPLYPRSSPEQVDRLVADAGVSAAVVDGAAALDCLREAGVSADLEFVAAMDDVEAATGLDAVYRRGADRFDPGEYRSWLDAREPGDLASVVYTSGTGGRRKGVALTHRNLHANVEQCYRRFGPRPGDPAAPAVDSRARTVSVLPLSHLFERVAGHFLMVAAGAQVAYAGSHETFREDCRRVRPTVGTVVPRVCERIHDAVREEVRDSPLPDRVFEWACGVAREAHETPDPGPLARAEYAVADRLVFRRVREALGGKLDFLVSGGSSLSPELCAVFHGMGLPVLEGYGLTEAGPVVSANPPEAPAVGTVGPPLSGCEVRVDESVGGDLGQEGTVGELLVRGPNVATYWDPAAEAARAAEGGWLRTGDVVERRPDGYLRFVERAKELLTLSTGKNVAPGPVEDALVVASPLVEQCMLVGDGRPFVAALVVPDFDAVGAWADGAGVALPRGPAAVCGHPRVQDRVGEDVARVNREREPHETVKRFRLLPERFSVAAGLLTPTLKKKRGAILEQFDDEVAALYE